MNLADIDTLLDKARIRLERGGQGADKARIRRHIDALLDIRNQMTRRHQAAPSRIRPEHMNLFERGELDAT